MEHGLKDIAFNIKNHTAPCTHNFPAGSPQASRGACICETSLLHSLQRKYKSFRRSAVGGCGLNIYDMGLKMANIFQTILSEFDAFWAWTKWQIVSRQYFHYLVTGSRIGGEQHFQIWTPDGASAPLPGEPAGGKCHAKNRILKLNLKRTIWAVLHCDAQKPLTTGWPVIRSITFSLPCTLWRHQMETFSYYRPFVRGIHR